MLILLLEEYIKKYGSRKKKDSLGNVVDTNKYRIVFDNGYCSSIIYPKNTDGTCYSVAVCDYDGYLNWLILRKHGAVEGLFICKDIKEVIEACEVIRNLWLKNIARVGESY